MLFLKNQPDGAKILPHSFSHSCTVFLKHIRVNHSTKEPPGTTKVKNKSKEKGKEKISKSKGRDDHRNKTQKQTRYQNTKRGKMFPSQLFHNRKKSYNNKKQKLLL